VRVACGVLAQLLCAPPPDQTTRVVIDEHHQGLALSPLPSTLLCITAMRVDWRRGTHASHTPLTPRHA
jgi:hypothetical protein